MFRPIYGGGDYVLYLVVGLAIWNFVSNCVTLGATVFVSNAGLILNLVTRPLSHVLRLWTNISIRFFFQLAVFVPVAVYLGVLTDVLVLTAFTALITLLLMGIPIIVITAFLTTYIRDAEHFISVAMRFLFFLTPVFWIPGEDRIQSLVVQFNPFYYVLELARAPLLGISPDWFVWQLNMLFLAGGTVTAYLLLTYFGRRLPLWL